MKYRFSRTVEDLPAVSDREQIQELTLQLKARPRGPIPVTIEVREAAEAELVRLVREHVHSQNRQPLPADFTRIVQLHPTLLRLSRGDLVADGAAMVR